MRVADWARHLSEHSDFQEPFEHLSGRSRWLSIPIEARAVFVAASFLQSPRK
jgi:hypothetical protein